jgi:GTP-binding protein
LPGAIIAVVGAPNVGKSTLFNRLVGGRPAIVTRESGTTRDRQYEWVRDVPAPFLLVDTGGLSGGEDSPLAKGIDSQVEKALREASGVLLVVDCHAGITALDRGIASMLRRRSLSVLIVANKVDVPSHEPLAAEFFALGFGEPIPVSAAHGIGFERLVDEIEKLLGTTADTPALPSDPEAPAALRVALVGRPNVGKSSLLNRMLGEERYLVTDLPGTTRDAVDTLIRHEGRPYVLVDTAGMRRRGKVQAETESLAVERARANIRRSDVVVLVVDGSEELTAQDAHVAGYVQEAFRPLIVMVNKWDLLDDREESAKRWERVVRERLKFARTAPILLVSAKTGQRVHRIFDLVDQVYGAGGIQVSTGVLNRWLREVAGNDPSAPAVGRSVRLLYATQTGVHPPRFLFFCNDPRRIHFSLRRRLENALRERFAFGPSPVQLQFRSRRGRQEAR